MSALQIPGLHLEEGDLATTQADVLVNTIGTEAKLVAGSVTYAILQGGGQSIQDELTHLHPLGLKVGGIAQTQGGKLPCKKIFHVVLTHWVNENDAAEQILYKVVKECLEWTVQQNFASIAFPALGAGYHRFPGYRSADVMFRAIGDFQHNSDTKLNVKIIFHGRDEITKKDFMARYQGVDIVHENYLSREVLLKKDKFERGNDVTLKIMIGCLSQLEVDVLVNTTQNNLDLSVGGVSRTLLMRGGQVLQEECLQQCPSGLEDGGVVMTQSGNLKSQKVLHVVLPSWNNGDETSKVQFKSVVVRCLHETSKLQYKSIGFPALGTGFLKYPAKVSIALLMEVFSTFLQNEPQTSVKTIAILVAHKDVFIRKCFEGYAEGRGDTSDLLQSTLLLSNPAEVAMMVPGEMEALSSGEVKYFTLEQGRHKKNSPEDQHFKMVASHFFKQLDKDDDNRHIYKIIKIEYVVNPKLVLKFFEAQEKIARVKKEYATPTLAYHGTPEENVRSICEEGFRLPDHEDFSEETDVGWYGHGVYFSEFPRFAMNYMKRSKKLLLCKVLRGKVFKCLKRELGEPKMPGFDSHADPFGKEIIVFDDDWTLPSYIIHFEVCERFKKNDDETDPCEEDKHEEEFLTEFEMHKGEKNPENHESGFFE